MSKAVNPPRLATLADLKDAIENLALARPSLSLAGEILMTSEMKTGLDAGGGKMLRSSHSEPVKYASDVFERLFALEPKV